MSKCANKLLRVPGPASYRLMAVQINGERLYGQTAGRSLREDIAAQTCANSRPLYAIFVRPKPGLRTVPNTQEGRG